MFVYMCVCLRVLIYYRIHLNALSLVYVEGFVYNNITCMFGAQSIQALALTYMYVLCCCSTMYIYNGDVSINRENESINHQFVSYSGGYRELLIAGTVGITNTCR